MENKDIIVSICCITYNHEKYIQDTLEGFLAQKVNFKFEILIHDDASTDNTTKIIKEYEKKYPNIIRCIYQTKNQYSKNKKITATYLFPKARGKYIAICEGDDYWSDEKKLQKQVDILQNNKDISLCVHATKQINKENNEVTEIKGYKEDNIIGLEAFFVDYYKNKQQFLFHTSSYVFRKEFIDELLYEKPDFYYKACVGDTPLVLFLATKGKIYYIDEFMSVYRINTESSWTKNEFNGSQKKSILLNLREMYISFNKYTYKKYEKEINPFVNYFTFNILILEEKYKELFKKCYKEEFLSLNRRNKIWILSNAFSPKFASTLKRIKRMLKRECI